MQALRRNSRDARVEALRAAPQLGLNGIDLIEVGEDLQTLRVYFVHPLASPPDDPQRFSIVLPEEVEVCGGAQALRIPVVAVQSAAAVEQGSSVRCMIVRLAHPGDAARYTLRLQDDRGKPLRGFDPPLTTIEFTFVLDDNQGDCSAPAARSNDGVGEPGISYLARDYASFRRLMLDRLSAVLPRWTERNPADLGVLLVEALALKADHLSYYQDAVATEAYLGTARRRVSLRRHARVLDYQVHEGNNARTWLTFHVNQGSLVDGRVLRSGLPVATQLNEEQREALALAPREAVAAVLRSVVVFETLHDLRLRAAHSAIRFHTWGDDACCLPSGATHATLRSSDRAADALDLRIGDVLIFEEEQQGDTFADAAQRHAVRLVRVESGGRDWLAAEAGATGLPLVDVEWAADDALPFPLCLSEGTWVARGNTALADHGLTLSTTAPGLLSVSAPLLEPPVATQRRYYPKLLCGDVTFAVPYRHSEALGASAAAALRQEASRATAQICLFDGVLPPRWAAAADPEDDGPGAAPWVVRRDLLSSHSAAREFVLETESDGTARMRFGDGFLGAAPAFGTRFNVRFRSGTGTPGNVRSEELRCFIYSQRDPLGATAWFQTSGQSRGTSERLSLQGVRVRNPLPAVGGADPEPLTEVRLCAPQAFKRRQERAVTEEDWRVLAEAHPEVQRAAVTARWTGSWYTMYVTVDRFSGRPVDSAFKELLCQYLEPYRLLGYSIEIDGPRYVPVELELEVEVHSDHLRTDVERALTAELGSGELANGRRGFFHPDGFSFAVPVYLSQIVERALRVTGVHRVYTLVFQRVGRPAKSGLATGVLRCSALEIARMDNDPRFPENGGLRLRMRGGR